MTGALTAISAAPDANWGAWLLSTPPPLRPT